MGEATFPVSSLVCKKGGMVVICAGTTGFNLTFDVRYMWMHQKRLQGSHFAHLKQASSANKLMVERRLDPCMSEVFSWPDLPGAHMKMLRNEHKPGNMAVLVQSPVTGLRTLEEALPWLGATVEIKYEQSKSALKIGISGICGHPKGRVSVQTEGHGYVTHTRDPHPIQVRGKRHPNSTEIMCKWRELDALVRG